MTGMLTTVLGGNALSAFRAAGLLAKLQAIVPGVSGVAARHAHWVRFDEQPTDQVQSQVARLLTYGEPYLGPAPEDGTLIVGEHGQRGVPVQCDDQRIVIASGRHRPQLRIPGPPHRAGHAGGAAGD